jgi:hypothetical protein
MEKVIKTDFLQYQPRLLAHLAKAAKHETPDEEMRLRGGRFIETFTDKMVEKHGQDVIARFLLSVETWTNEIVNKEIERLHASRRGNKALIAAGAAGVALSTVGGIGGTIASIVTTAGATGTGSAIVLSGASGFASSLAVSSGAVGVGTAVALPIAGTALALTIAAPIAIVAVVGIGVSIVVIRKAMVRQRKLVRVAAIDGALVVDIDSDVDRAAIAQAWEK